MSSTPPAEESAPAPSTSLALAEAQIEPQNGPPPTPASAPDSFVSASLDMQIQETQGQSQTSAPAPPQERLDQKAAAAVSGPETQAIADQASTSVTSVYLPSIVSSVTLPGGLDILFREIPEDCRALLTLADIAESANTRGYFTVCELLALKIVLMRRYRTKMNGGQDPEPESTSPSQVLPVQEPSEQVECRPLVKSGAPKALKQVNAKRRTSWSPISSGSEGGDGGGSAPPKQKQANRSRGGAGAAAGRGQPVYAQVDIGPDPPPVPTSSLQTQVALAPSTSTGVLHSNIVPNPNYAICSQGCCTRPPMYVPTDYTVNSGVGPMEIDISHSPHVPVITTHNTADMYYMNEGGTAGVCPYPRSSTIHYAPSGTLMAMANGVTFHGQNPYQSYGQQYSNMSGNMGYGNYGPGQNDPSTHANQQQQQQQQALVQRSVTPVLPPGPPVRDREVRHVPPPPPYRSLALVLRLLQVGNYSFRSFSEVNPNRCKVLFNTQHILYECHLPIVQPPICDSFQQPLRKLLTIDIKFEQISHMQFEIDKLYLRVEGPPGLTVTYSPVTPEDSLVPPLSPQDQLLLEQIENGQLKLSPVHQLYFLNERLVHNLKSHFREMPQFARYFQHENVINPNEIPMPVGPSPPVTAVQIPTSESYRQYPPQRQSQSTNQEQQQQQ